MIISNQQALQRQLDKKSSGLRLLLDALEKIEYGQIQIKTPQSGIYQMNGKKPGPQIELAIYHDSFFDQVLSKGDIGLAESYMSGQWSTNNLTDFIEFGILNQKHLENAFYGNWFNLLVYKTKHLFQANTKNGSKKNISKHYDLGNKFYNLWLDKTMTYSSAYWGNKTTVSVEEAQKQKYQRILDLIDAKQGDHILEIGCGWGGFAEHAARQGIKVTGVTISKEQFNFATERINKQNLNHLVEILFKDYRDIEGKFDHTVSIEMIEAVGKEYWKTYFDKIKSVTKPSGRVALQSIVMNDSDFKKYLAGTDFIQQYIFPGGVLLSPNTIKELINQIDGQRPSLESFGLDYARTLEYWNLNFQQKWKEIEQMGFDTTFKKMWEFYFSYCEGAFKAKKIDVLFISFKL